MTRVSGPGESAGPSLNVPPAQFDQPRPVPDRPGPGRQPRPLTLQDSSSHGGHRDCLYRPRKLSVSVADHIFKVTTRRGSIYIAGWARPPVPQSRLTAL